MAAEITDLVVGTFMLAGGIATGRTHLVFGPPDEGLQPPGDNPDAMSTALVLSGANGYPDPTDADWFDAIEVLRTNYPDRAIYAWLADGLVAVGFTNSETGAPLVTPPSPDPNKRREYLMFDKPRADGGPERKPDATRVFLDLNKRGH